MSKTITIASIQMFVHKNKKQNVEQVKKHLKYLSKVFPQVEMVVFPELSVSESALEPEEQAENIPGELTGLFSRLAKKHGLWLIPGSIYEKSGSKVYNTSVVFSPEGDLVGKYRKRFPWCPYEKTVPGKDPFVKLNSQVSKGDTILIIEAMKVMNTITAPKSGKIVFINFEDSQPVEFDQLLAVIE